jgi:AdoMet-dependent heme synthase
MDIKKPDSRIEIAVVDAPAPEVPLSHLDDLWFQVGGTLCNLRCTHCFISCHPHNHTFGFMDLETVRRYLEESVGLGVKEYYFTGGEPFLNKEMTEILEMTLQYGPATVLTNGTVLKDAWLERLRAAAESSPYSLEFRVSLDGFTPEENDALRGKGTFEQILRGIGMLVQHGFLPIVTVTRTRDDDEDGRLFAGFAELLRARGYPRPRIKILPTLRIGAEAQRSRGYHDDEVVTPEMMAGFDTASLVCSHARMATDRGVYVCPILIEAPGARLGDTLVESLRPFALRYHACFTCYKHGSLCSNATSVLREA